MHDVVVVGIQLVAILTSILLQRRSYQMLRREVAEGTGELSGLRTDIGALGLNYVQGLQRSTEDLWATLSLTAKLEGRIDEIAKR